MTKILNWHNMAPSVNGAILPAPSLAPLVPEVSSSWWPGAELAWENDLSVK